MSLCTWFRRGMGKTPERAPETREVEDVTLCIELTGGRKAMQHFVGRAARRDSCYLAFSGAQLAEEFVHNWKCYGTKIIGEHVALWDDFVSATVVRSYRTVVLP